MMRRVSAIAFIAFVIPAGVVGACATDRDVVYEDDFSSDASGWPISTSPGGQEDWQYAEGGYRIRVLEPGNVQTAGLSLGFTVKQLGIEAEFLERGEEGVAAFHGIGCYETGRAGYDLLINLEGRYRIQKSDLTLGSGALEILDEGDIDPSVNAVGLKNVVRAECRAGGSDPTVVTLFVNDERVAEATEANGVDDFAAIAFIADSREHRTDLLIDNVVAWEL